MYGKIFLSLLITFILFLLLWAIRGAVHTPVYRGKNMRLTLHLQVEGCAPELEAAVDDLLWLMWSGVLPGRLVIEDMGMDEETRQVAEYLTKDNGRIELWTNGKNN